MQYACWFPLWQSGKGATGHSRCDWYWPINPYLAAPSGIYFYFKYLTKAAEKSAKERDKRMTELIERIERQRELKERDAKEKAAKEKVMEGRKSTAAPRNTKRNNHPSSIRAQNGACRR